MSSGGYTEVGSYMEGNLMEKKKVKTEKKKKDH